MGRRVTIERRERGSLSNGRPAALTLRSLVRCSLPWAWIRLTLVVIQFDKARGGALERCLVR